MSQYKTLNVKLSNLQLDKLKSETKMELSLLWIFHQIWLKILMMKLIFHVNYYLLIHKFQSL